MATALHPLLHRRGPLPLPQLGRRALELEAKFSGDDLGISEFREYLQRRSAARCSRSLADLAGEDFHEEQIPFLRGSDREAVVQRRLAQRYRDTRLAAALSLGQAAAGERRNERLLLASFTNTQQLAPWLDALEEAGARLAGVYSVPLLAPALAARLGVRSGRAFVVTAHRAGLRQCFVEDGRLRFARLERTVEMVPQALAAFVRSETLRLAQYLATLRVLPREGGAGAGAGGGAARAAHRFRAGAAVGRAAACSARWTPPRRRAPSGLRSVPARQRRRGAVPAPRGHAAAARAVRQSRTTGAATSSGSCSAASSPRARSASPPARCTPARDGSTSCRPREHARSADRAGARRRRAVQRITAAFPVDADLHREPQGRRWSSSPRIAERSALPERAFAARVARAGEVPAVRDRRASTGASARRASAREAGAPRREARRRRRRRRVEISRPRQRHAAQRLPRHHRAGAALRRRAGRVRLRARAHAAALRRHLRGHAHRRHRRGAETGEAPRFTIVLARRLP